MARRPASPRAERCMNSHPALRGAHADALAAQKAEVDGALGVVLDALLGLSFSVIRSVS